MTVFKERIILPYIREKCAVGVGTITNVNERFLRGSVKNNLALPHNI